MGEKETWGIIGGGLIGMTLALRLAQEGYKVTVFESEQKLGGLTGEVCLNGIAVDRFYHVILLSDLNTRKVIKEIGLENELIWNETKTGFFSGGQLYSMSNIFDFLRFPLINLADKFRLGCTILIASQQKNLKRMESFPVETWLTKWSGKKVFDKIWLPLLKSKLGESYKNTSASFILTTIQRMYAARRTGLKKEMFGYISGGYKKINEAFRKKLLDTGVNLMMNSSVRKISRQHLDKLTVTLASGDIFKFDRVISTLPSDISAQITPSLTKEENEKCNSIQYMGVVCLTLLLNKTVSEYYITNITDIWPPFTGVIEMTALINPEYTGNCSLVYLPKYARQDDELFSMSKQDIKSQFLNALFKMYPDLSDKNIVAWEVSTAKRVFALPVLHYSDLLPDVSTSLKGYYIINSAQIINGTVNVNETIGMAESKIKEILKSQDE